MTFQVSIINGHYRGGNVTGVFPLVKEWQAGTRGGFVTIRNPQPKPGHPEVQRISVGREGCQVLDAEGNEVDATRVQEATKPVQAGLSDYEAEFANIETDEEAKQRIRETFAMLDKIVDSCARGVMRGLVVSGPPGIGKSTGVIKQLDAANMFRVLEGNKAKYEVVSGGISDIGLYQKLYNNRDADRVIVFDDADDVLLDEGCMMLMKAALNTGNHRRICWNKESNVLDKEGIPNSFQFDASVIVLSNIDFEKTIARGSRISNHLEAIMSRCHYLDLEIVSQSDKLRRISQVIEDGMLKEYGFTSIEEQVLWDYIVENADYLREISIRMTKKIADLMRSDPQDWRTMVESTCMVREAKFKRLVEKKRRLAEAGVDSAEV